MASNESAKIGFWGAGNIVQAMAKGFIASGNVEPSSMSAVATRKDSPNLLKLKDMGLMCPESVEDMVKSVDVLVLAVKPYNALDVLKKHVFVKQQEKPKSLISVVACVPLEKLREAYDVSCQRQNSQKFIIYRLSLNTSVAVCAGLCALSVEECFENEVDTTAILTLLSHLGSARLYKEKLLDSITACSGSGIAFMYSVLEAMSDAGVLVGLTRPDAQHCAAETMLGAAAMMKETGRHPAELKDAVSSPGGTTIGGIHALEKGGMRAALMDAVYAAKRRAEELRSNPKD